jgi:hypothetical protein
LVEMVLIRLSSTEPTETTKLETSKRVLTI